MARLFSSAEVRTAIGQSSGNTWAAMSHLAVVRRSADGGTRSILAADSSGLATRGHMGVRTGGLTNRMMYNHQGTSFADDGVEVLVAHGWVMLGWTKPTGNVPVRFHSYIYATGVWAHLSSAINFNVITAAGAGGFWRVGQNSFSEPWAGDIAAVCSISGRALSDSEVEQAARGNWWRYSPVFWKEFPSGPDKLQLGRSIGRDATRDTLLTSTSRTLSADPPGFRFSPANRRGH